MHSQTHNACMPQVTIRNLEEDWIEGAKKIALDEGKSMNTVFKEIISVALGKPPENEAKPKTNGLERFAGTWVSTPEEDAEWEKFLNEDLMQIDEDLWK